MRYTGWRRRLWTTTTSTIGARVFWLCVGLYWLFATTPGTAAGQSLDSLRVGMIVETWQVQVDSARVLVEGEGWAVRRLIDSLPHEALIVKSSHADTTLEGSRYVITFYRKDP